MIHNTFELMLTFNNKNSMRTATSKQKYTSLIASSNITLYIIKPVCIVTVYPFKVVHHAIVITHCRTTWYSGNITIHIKSEWLY